MKTIHKAGFTFNYNGLRLDFMILQDSIRVTNYNEGKKEEWDFEHLFNEL